ncbi:MAG: SDR family oxidoreductase [Caulobacterales bacterium]
MSLKGKTAIITGASNGIGYAIAEAMGADGANILIADVVKAEEAAAALKAKGVSAIGVKADVTSQDDTQEMVRTATEKFGGVDILINNAALFTGLVGAPLEQLQVAEWRKVMDVNVMGPWLCAVAASEQLRARKGVIINIGSIISMVGVPYMLHYVASKGAIEAMTRAMAREFGASGVRVNSIAPGYVHSPNMKANEAQHAQFEAVAATMRTLPQPLEPKDLVGAAMYLAGPGAASVTGQSLVVDGGMFLR